MTITFITAVAYKCTHVTLFIETCTYLSEAVQVRSGVTLRWIEPDIVYTRRGAAALWTAAPR